MDNEIKVSIQCLVYNHEPYLRECLDGFVMQKTNFKFEAIVHDDCSTDGSTAIIKEYAEKYPNIIKPILETENQYSKGGGLLRKIMDSHMRGTYVAMCEGDGYWTDPTKLQQQVDYLESHLDCALCFHDAEIVAEKGRDYYDVFGKLETRDYSIDELLREWKVPTCSMVVRGDVFFNRPNNAKFRMGDNVIYITAAQYGKIHCIAKKMGVYRLNSTSWIGSQSNTAMAYKYLSHYKGLIEEFESCRCDIIYHLMEERYFQLMATYKLQRDKGHFNEVKAEYEAYPGTVHLDKFKSYYRKASVRYWLKGIIGDKLVKLYRRLRYTKG